jgi:hypothetical protein
MASVYCRSCEFNHPRPVGTHCIFQSWLQQLDDMSGEEAPIQDAASQVSNVPIITGDTPVTSTSTILTATSTTTSGSLQTDTIPQGSDPPRPVAEPEPVQRHEALNSTTHSEAPSRASRGSNRSRASVTDDMLFEMRVMNRNFGLMYKAQFDMMQESKQHMSRIEEKINVSTFVNTSVGLSVSPYINNSNGYIVCSTQAGPTYTTASTTQVAHGTPQWSAQLPVAAQRVYQPAAAANTHSLQAMRTDPIIKNAVQQQCEALDYSSIGMPQTVTNKKSRGLTRAGGKRRKRSIQTGCMTSCLWAWRTVISFTKI